MNRNISEVCGTLRPESAGIRGEFLVKVFRADGRVEEKVLKNIITRAGLNHLANLGINAGATPFYIIGVGTATAAHTLDSGQGNLGEVLRKTGNAVQSREWMALQCTIGGAADSVTSVALDTAFISVLPTSHATNGWPGNAANGLGVTLGGSDMLDLTVRWRIGSHDLSHST